MGDIDPKGAKHRRKQVGQDKEEDKLSESDIDKNKDDDISDLEDYGQDDGPDLFMQYSVLLNFNLHDIRIK